jgi:hypothetical protein
MLERRERRRRENEEGISPEIATPPSPPGCIDADMWGPRWVSEIVTEPCRRGSREKATRVSSF